MAPHPAPTVLVIGAGPTGLALGIELRRRNVAVRLVDKLRAPGGIAKACGIMPRTLEVLEGMGVVERFLEAGLHVRGFVTFGDGMEELLSASFEGVESPYPFILALEQFHTERFLCERFVELGGVVERGVELVGFEQDAGGVRARLLGEGGEEVCEVEYLAGCDGAHSAVRHGLGLSFPGAEYPQDFVLGHVRLDWPVSRGEMCLLVGRKGMLFASPTPDGRWLFAADLSGEQKALVHEGAPTLDDLAKVVAARAPAGARISDPIWTSFFRVHHRQVERYGVGRVFLCGDAAHIHTPLGGQGMNTGIQDAYNLGWKLSLVARGEASGSLLESYDAERRPVGREVLESTNEMQVSASFRNPVLQRARTAVMRAMGHVEIVRHLMMEELGETAYSYRGGPLAREHLDAGLRLHPDARHPGFEDVRAFHHGPRAGDRAPDAGEGAARLFGRLGSGRFALLLFEGGHCSEADVGDLAGLAGALADRYAAICDVCFVTPFDKALVAPRVPTIVDEGQRIHRRYGARGECLVLVRPDGYIGFRSQPIDAGRLADYFFEVAGIVSA